MLRKMAILGECMLELRQVTEPDGDSGSSLPVVLSYGGDTLNTAVYLSRLGNHVEYVTAVGTDNMSAWMMRQWRKEGVGCEHVECVEGQPPGIYLIELNDEGERFFIYWRDQAPVRKMFSSAHRTEQLFSALCAYDTIYLSGITLGIYDRGSRSRLIGMLREFRKCGGKIIFDGNYREKLWEDAEEARSAYAETYGITDIALPTLEDEMRLFDDHDRADVIRRIRSFGVDEIALKMGPDGCLVANNDFEELVPVKAVNVVDTTSAGDSFNAAYICLRLRGEDEITAARGGHTLASNVIQHKGAIIPQEMMPAL